VIPGKYTIVATDTILHEFADDRVQGQKVTVTRGDVASVRLELTPVTATVADVCRGASLPMGTSLLAGHLDLPDSVLPHDAQVRALWQSIEGASRATLHAQNMDRDAPVDRRSRFVVCGLGRERPVRLQLMRNGVILADTTFIVPDRLIVPVRWRAP